MIMNEDALSFSKPRKNFNGGQSVIIKDQHTGVNPLLSLKRMHWVSDSKSVILNLSDTDRQFVHSLDNLVLQKAREHQTEWFGRTLTLEKLKSLHQSSFHPDGTFRAKVSPNIQVYDILHNVTECERLDGQCVDVKLAIVGIYFKPGRFGVSYNIRQVKLLPAYGLSRYAFEDDSQDEFSDADSN